MYSDSNFALFFCVKKDESSVTGNMRSESYVGGVIYQQLAEVAALYKQTFELAKLQLDKRIAENGGTGENLAIVTDIDATLIDDSGYFAGALTDSKGRKAMGKDSWNNKDWCGYYTSEASDVSKAVPGAVEFVNYARSQGVKIYFITNRPYYELDLTVKQLYHERLLDEETVKAYSGLEADNGSLQNISADEYKYTSYSEDESKQFDRKNGNAVRSEAVMNELWKDKWGTEFIVMPNSAYGD